MLAVAENGGRIRPPVTIVKALASAICIGSGGSVGREGPIVQIGSAFASTLGQLVRMSENRLRIIVACGAAGGIAATFNAPITGLFFGFEIVLREFSLDALCATALAAVTGDVVSRAFFGSAPFFTAVPHDLVLGGDANYLLIALLGIAAGLVGVAFKTVLYGLEDRVDELWRGRPEWLRPAVGGHRARVRCCSRCRRCTASAIPVMDRVLGGHVVLWLIVIFMLGKIARVEPHALDRRLRRRVRALAVHRRRRRHGVRPARSRRLRSGRRSGRPVRRRRDGRRVRRRGAGPADRDRERRRDDRQLHPHAADHARQRDRLRALQAPDLRQHLHDQTAAPRHRHRATAPDRSAPAADRRGRDAAADRARGSRPARPAVARSARHDGARTQLGATRWPPHAHPRPPSPVPRRNARASAAPARALQPHRAARDLARR